MNIYEDILRIDEATFDNLMSIGLLRPSAKENLDIYSYYLQECEKGNGKMQAMINTADEFNKTDEAIKKIIYKIRKHVRALDTGQ